MGEPEKLPPLYEEPSVPSVVSVVPAETTPMGPIQAGERIETLDILRGFAILGILIVNMVGFHSPFMWFAANMGQWDGRPADQTAIWWMHFLAQGKFVTMFSFLFGMGLSVMLLRAESRGRGVAGVYARRLLVLLGIGLVHAFLIWMGDILVTYSVVGFALLLFRHRRPKTIMIWSVVLLALPLLIYGGVAASVVMGKAFAPEEMEKTFAAAAANQKTSVERSLQVYAKGSFSEISALRAEETLMLLTFSLIFGFTMVLGMFLLGLYFGKRRLIELADQHRPVFLRLLFVGLLIGIPGNLVYAYFSERVTTTMPDLNGFLAQTGLLIGGPALCLAYISAVVLLCQQNEIRKLLTPVGAVGRMALTNYLSHSLICTFIFYNATIVFGRGLGYFGQMGPAASMGLVAVIYIAQLIWSPIWLRYFKFGPMEWLWRSLTYGKMQPMWAGAGGAKSVESGV